MTGPTLDEICAKHGLLKPSRRDRIINSTPRVGQCYWVDFAHDAYPPEFVGEHPGVVIRAAQSFADTCIIVPVTSTPQEVKRHVHKLSKNPNRKYPEKPVWAVCNHLYTIHLSRLRPIFDHYGASSPARATKDDMESIYACIRHALPNVFASVTTVVSQTTTITVVEPSD